jgi:hypothetical protein
MLYFIRGRAAWWHEHEYVDPIAMWREALGSEEEAAEGESSSRAGERDARAKHIGWSRRAIESLGLGMGSSVVEVAASGSDAVEAVGGGHTADSAKREKGGGWGGGGSRSGRGGGSGCVSKDELLMTAFVGSSQVSSLAPSLTPPTSLTPSFSPSLHVTLSLSRALSLCPPAPPV